jgi:hypothetical protein
VHELHLLERAGLLEPVDQRAERRFGVLPFTLVPLGMRFCALGPRRLGLALAEAGLSAREGAVVVAREGREARVPLVEGVC